jgi:hypothetical protein
MKTKTSRKSGSKTKKSTTKKSTTKKPTITFKKPFEDSPEFQQFGTNALSYFALSHYLRIEDLEEFAANSDVEGSDDKKADICHISVSDGLALIAQSYLASKWDRVGAPANKASDLNTAMAWLLSTDEKTIPVGLRSKAIDLRKSLADGDIKRLELLYIHNCPESANVENELKVVADATRDLVSVICGDNSNSITVAHRELGLRSIEDLYKSRDSDIMIDEWITLPIKSDKGYIEERGNGWRSILTTVPGDWIQELYNENGDRLFSANYRDYLGSSNRKGNINYLITQTAESESTNFWVYNNGITALTHEIALGKTQKIRGISIINGAQTTGSLSQAGNRATKLTRVMMRIVECSSKELIGNIIQYNNTQNYIKPADMRSNDNLQKRLKLEFKEKYDITYAHRRSSAKVPRNAITCHSMGAPLSAFHGDPQTAYRKANDVFNDDKLYQKVFRDGITPEHIFLVRAISVAIDKVKAELKSKITEDTATDLDLKQYDVLKFSASKHFLLYLIGECADQIMNRRVADKYNWRCKKEVISADNVSLINACIRTLKAILPQVSVLINREGVNASYEVPRSFELSKKVAVDTKAIIASLPILATEFADLRQRTSI